MTMERKHDFVRGHCSFCENVTSVGVVTKTGKGRACMVCQRKMANIIGGQDRLERLERALERLVMCASAISLEELGNYRPQRYALPCSTVESVARLVDMVRIAGKS